MANSSSLSGLIAAVGASATDTRRLEALVDQLRIHGCSGLEDKLDVWSRSVQRRIFSRVPVKGDTRVSLSSWLADAITRKARKAPGRQGTMHFVGLIVDEVYASTGDVLTNTFLGGLVAAGGGPEPVHCYRSIPNTAGPELLEARRRGRGKLVDQMQFDLGKSAVGRYGLVFDPTVQKHVDGIFALYYTNMLQFIPNPFTPRNIEAPCELFPDAFKPFEVPGDAPSKVLPASRSRSRDRPPRRGRNAK